MKGYAQHQCAVTTGGGWATRSPGLAYVATAGWYAGYCAPRGNQNIKYWAVQGCRDKRNQCGNNDHCVADSMAQHLAIHQVCHGGSYALLYSAANNGWYAYSGSSSGESNGHGGRCIVFCN